MRRVLYLALAAVVLVTMAGCGSAPERQTIVTSDAVAPAAEAPPSQGGVFEESAADSGSVAGHVEVAPDPRKIIYQAFLSIVVKDPEASLKDIEALAARAGGYVSQSQLNQYYGDLMRGNIVIRVPVESYQTTLDAIRALGIRVINENSNASDVTAEYTDLEAQLRNLEAAERELQAMLTEVRERPNAKPSDILEVYNALTEKRGQIEQVKGRLQYLANQVSLSTITADLVPDEGEKPVVEEGWQPLVTVKNSLRTLVSVLQGLFDTVITLVIVVLPIVLLLAVPIVLIVLLIRWLRGRRKASASSE
ncbi:MAG: DUF4349 domain-containing protein [Caldilineales bacterium]